MEKMKHRVYARPMPTGEPADSISYFAHPERSIDTELRDIEHEQTGSVALKNIYYTLPGSRPKDQIQSSSSTCQ